MHRILRGLVLPIVAADNQFTITGSSDATKTLKFECDTQDTGADLTISAGAQTADRTLSIPVLTANATLMVLSESQTVTGAKSFTAGIAISGVDAQIVDIDIVLSPATGTKIGTGSNQKIALWGATPIVRPSSTGETTGWTSGGGSAATSTDTYTGNSGTKAYTVNDIVKHLKAIGLLASS